MIDTNDQNPIRLFNEIEAASFLNLSASALQRWRVVGSGPPFVRVSNRCVRYRLEDLERWIASKTIPKASGSPEDSGTIAP